jgi:AsmA protein
LLERYDYPKARFGLGGGAHSGTGSAAEFTDFSEISASFRIDHGVAHNEDLLAKTPLLRVAGSGDIDIGQGKLDYTVRATVVSTLQGQGGPELQALRGQTVPVRLVGPFSAIGYQIDYASLAKDLAQQALGGKAQEAKEAVKQQLGNKLKGLLGK